MERKRKELGDDYGEGGVGYKRLKNTREIIVEEELVEDESKYKNDKIEYKPIKRNYRQRGSKSFYIFGENCDDEDEYGEGEGEGEGADEREGGLKTDAGDEIVEEPIKPEEVEEPDQLREANFEEFLQKHPKLQKKLKDVRHADAVYFHDYRGLGLWIIEELEDGTRMMHKTLGEYGYIIPIQVSDAPLDYFEEDNEQRFIYPPCVIKDSEMGKELEGDLNSIKENPEFQGTTKFDSCEKLLIDLNKFPKDYLFCFYMGDTTWIPFSGMFNYDYSNNTDIQRYIRRTIRPWKRFCERAFLITRLVAKTHNVPKGVANIIANFVIEAYPYPFFKEVIDK